MAWPTLQAGDVGSPVKGLSRGLTRALDAAAVCTSGQRSYDYAVQRDVMLFQRRAALHVDGVCGAATWHALGAATTPGGSPALDLKAKAWIRFGGTQHVTAEDAVRNRAVHYMNWWLAHRLAIPYQQVRPYPHFHAGSLSDADMRRGSDCSGAAITITEAAGGRDPSGFGFDGSGNTDSMLSHARARGLLQSLGVGKRGDYVHYAGHVVMQYEDSDGVVPMVFSFGHYPAGLYSAHYRTPIAQQQMEIAA